MQIVYLTIPILSRIILPKNIFSTCPLFLSHVPKHRLSCNPFVSRCISHRLVLCSHTLQCTPNSLSLFYTSSNAVQLLLSWSFLPPFFILYLLSPSQATLVSLTLHIVPCISHIRLVSGFLLLWLALPLRGVVHTLQML